MLSKISKYFSSVVKTAEKTTWPTKADVVHSSFFVAIISAIMGGMLFFADSVISFCLFYIMGVSL
jgi:preprotein translocase SecE subunit